MKKWPLNVVLPRIFKSSIVTMHFPSSRCTLHRHGALSVVTMHFSSSRCTFYQKSKFHKSDNYQGDKLMAYFSSRCTFSQILEFYYSETFQTGHL